eukprot:867145_1
MALKQWMQSNGVFDKELVRVFPQYDINDGSDLKNLTPSQWKEIKGQQIKDRAAEIKSAAAKKRFYAKLTKIEKLWKAARKPDKKKSKKHKKSNKSMASKQLKINKTAAPIKNKKDKKNKKEEKEKK